MYRTFYNAITVVQSALQSYMDAYKSDASHNTQLAGMCKELSFAPNTWGAG